MMYIVHYFDDQHRKHMTFIDSIKDLEFLKERFGEITVEAYKIE